MCRTRPCWLKKWSRVTSTRQHTPHSTFQPLIIKHRIWEHNTSFWRRVSNPNFLFSFSFITVFMWKLRGHEVFPKGRQRGAVCTNNTNHLLDAKDDSDCLHTFLLLLLLWLCLSFTLYPSIVNMWACFLSLRGSLSFPTANLCFFNSLLLWGQPENRVGLDLGKNRKDKV